MDLQRRRAQYRDQSVEGAKARARNGARTVLGSSKSTREGRSRQVLNEALRHRQQMRLPKVLEVDEATEEEIERERRGKENRAANGRMIPQKSFFFQQRHGKLDLRNLARVDIEKVVEDVDIDTIQMHLENLTFGELDSRDLRTYTDENFTKLFRLTQLTIEYLLNVQNTLYGYTATLEEQLAALERENNTADRKLSTQDSEIDGLKRELRQKKRTLKTYEFLLTQRSTRETLEVEQVSSNINIQEMERKQESDLRARLDLKSHELEIREQTINDQRAALQAQTEQMRKLLQDEAEAMKRKLHEEFEEKQRQYQNREENLQKREVSISRSDVSKRSKGISLAGETIEDDIDEYDPVSQQIQAQVEEILGSSSSLSHLKQELAKMINENSRLRTELNFAERSMKIIETSNSIKPQQQLKQQEQQRITETATQPTTPLSEPPDFTDQPAEDISHHDSSTQKKAALDEEEGFKEKDEGMMLKFAGGHVSRDLADQRSMQLRRVLRLVRRRIQNQYLGLWKNYLSAIRSLEKEKRLLVEMERLKAKIFSAEKDGHSRDNEEAEPTFEAAYRWQIVPREVLLLVESEKRLETREEEQGVVMARIPYVWPLEAETSIGRVTVAVSRKMKVQQVREKIAQELGKRVENVILQERRGGAVLDDESTVESNNLFNRPPFVNLSSKALSDEAIQQIVSDYRRSTEDTSSSLENRTTSHSPVLGQHQIKPRFTHSEEELQREQLEISQVLSRSLGSDPNLPLSASLHASTEALDQVHSVPVNFGDDFDGSSMERGKSLENTLNSSLRSSGGHSGLSVGQTSESGSEHGGSTYSSASQVSSRAGNLFKLKTPKDKSPMSREALVRRHQETMSRFTKVGLIRRAQINTLNLSDDSGSSRTATSVSSSGASKTGPDTLGMSGKSFFDVNRRADKYDGSSDAGSSAFDYTESTIASPSPAVAQSEVSKRNQSAVSRLLDEMEDDSDSDYE